MDSILLSVVDKLGSLHLLSIFADDRGLRSLDFINTMHMKRD